MKKSANTIKIPNRLICDAGLSLSARKVGVILYAHCNAFGFCHRSLRSLAALSGVSTATVRNAAEELAETGWLTVSRTYVWNKKLGRRVYGQKEYQLTPVPRRGWTRIPRDYINRNTNHAPAPFVIGLYLYVAGSRDRRAFPSISKIAGAVGVARSTVCRALHQIKQMGDFLVQLCRTAKNVFAANSYYLCTILHCSPVTGQEYAVTPGLSAKQRMTYDQPEAVPQKRNPLCAFILRLGKRLRNLFFKRGVVPNLANNS